uniref:Putative secreted protein n=1 Tax=Anopheles darlingi TaxID=43151 RepID=A0A2M4D8C3_ANODA
MGANSWFLFFFLFGKHHRAANIQAVPVCVIPRTKPFRQPPTPAPHVLLRRESSASRFFRVYTPVVSTVRTRTDGGKNRSPLPLPTTDRESEWSFWFARNGCVLFLLCGACTGAFLPPGRANGISIIDRLEKRSTNRLTGQQQAVCIGRMIAATAHATK